MHILKVEVNGCLKSKMYKVICDGHKQIRHDLNKLWRRYERPIQHFICLCSNCQPGLRWWGIVIMILIAIRLCLLGGHCLLAVWCKFTSHSLPLTICGFADSLFNISVITRVIEHCTTASFPISDLMWKEGN